MLEDSSMSFWDVRNNTTSSTTLTPVGFFISLGTRVTIRKLRASAAHT